MGAPIPDKRRDVGLVGREYDPEEGGSSRNFSLKVDSISKFLDTVINLPASPMQHSLSSIHCIREPGVQRFCKHGGGRG